MDVAQLVITSVLAAIGLNLAHSYRNQQRLRIAERRLDAYAKLWELTEVASPTRVTNVSVDRQGPLRQEEARKLYQQMIHWYYASGNGLLLPKSTKQLYHQVKERLGVYAVSDQSLPDGDGVRCMQELGVLRAQMRLDLDVYNEPYSWDEASDELLEAAGIASERWGMPPWRTRISGWIRHTVGDVTAKLPPRANPEARNSTRVHEVSVKGEEGRGASASTDIIRPGSAKPRAPK
jgi:hypothetical protein